MEKTRETSLSAGPRERVIRLASLSRLQFTEEEVSAFTPQIEAILNHVSELQAVDVTGVSPMLSPGELLGGKLRDDHVRTEEEQKQHSELTLKCAPQSVGRSFVVPPVL